LFNPSLAIFWTIILGKSFGVDTLHHQDYLQRILAMTPKIIQGFKESYRKFPDNLDQTFLILNISPKYEDLCYKREDGMIVYLTTRIKP